MSTLTKRAIKASFLKLLNDRPLEKITVKDIVEDCGINRNTFYYHFQDIPALLAEVIREEADRIIKTNAGNTSLEDCLAVAVEFSIENKKAVYHIYNSVNRAQFEQYLDRICQYVVEKYIDTVFADMKVKPDDKVILIRFYKYEIFGQIIAWLNDGMRYDVCAQFKRLCELKHGMMEETFRRSVEM